MAELATIARPYADALFKAGGDAAAAEQMSRLATVANDAQLRQLADNPKVSARQVFDLMAAVVGTPLSAPVQNLLLAILDNGRVAALPEIATQFHALINARSGVSDATVYSAFPIEAAALAAVMPSLEKRFGRRLNASVVVQPELIGGVRVVVGDEVLDTSVKARLEQMKTALTA